MSRYSEERRKYESDVFFDAWMSGGNPDSISFDRVEGSYYQGMYSEEAAHREVRAQRERIVTPEELG